MTAMCPPRVRKQVRKSTGIRQVQIVDAAMRIIASKGPRKFTAELLGARVGITAGAIFRHFKNMDAIIEAIVGRIEEILFEGFPPEAADPIERLGIFFQHRVRTIVTHPHVSRILLSDHLAQARRLEEFKRRSRDYVFKCLREASESGLLRGEAGPEEGTVLVLGVIFALAHSITRVPDPRKVEHLASRVWRIIESTLRGRRSSEFTVRGVGRSPQTTRLGTKLERSTK